MPDPVRPAPVQLSIVIPVFACADCLTALHSRLTATVRQITDSYELVFVDDRSGDGAWSLLQDLADADRHVRAFRLSRNFGQDAAITAGLAQARGEWGVVMDCDLQEAPEDIPRLWAAAAEGYDVVRTIRRGWQHARLRRACSRAYRRLTLQRADRVSYSNMSLLSRSVIDAFLRLRDRDREYGVAVDWLGYDSTAVEIDHHPRHGRGRSSYTFGRLLRVALDGVFFRSTALLRIVVLLGFLLAFVGLGAAAFEVGAYFAGSNRRVPGYTSLAVLLLVLSGFIITSVGVVGLYVGRIFEQVKDRPLYLIDSHTDAQAASAASTGPHSNARAPISVRSEQTPYRVPPGSRTRAGPEPHKAP